ncbi:Hypothetical predicted protein [Olea europaea subsp. europaea]|uniref:Peptidase M20 dimerisation domain-containing protein n=1 Tax=Olea europaea subsp. europaea TaxID=158383 RepID=A0A8S0SVI0_OLEEU|nr:Hypothetical predicted protein [Olea europaea subsp. europaea]
MIDAGALENVYAIFGLHVASLVPLAVVESRSGLLAGSGIFFEAVISGHAAIPQHSIDPILTASNVIVSLQHPVSLEADPLDSQVDTVAKIQGGDAFNVIPDSVTIGGTFRAFSKERLIQLKQQIEEKVASNVFGTDGVKDTQPLMGSEDFAYFQDLIPGYFFLRMKDDSMKHNPLPTFTAFCEDGLTYEAAMHALLVVRYPLERQIEPHVLTGDSKDEL